MPLTSAQQAALSAAIDRLQNYYDGDNPYNPATNPGGFRQGGQVVNFEPALKDTATVMNLASILVADATAAATNSPKALRVDSAQSFSAAEIAQVLDNLQKAIRADKASSLSNAELVQALTNIGLLKDGLTLTDAQIVQFLKNLGLGQIALGQCQFGFTSATQCTLKPINGGLLTINDNIRSLSAGGIAFANTLPGGATLAASTLYYAYAYWSGNSFAWEFSTTAFALDATGFPIKSGDPTRTCVGMCYTDASGKFQDTIGFRGVATYFNRTLKRASVTFNNVSISSNATILCQPPASCLSWGSDSISAHAQCFATDSVVNAAVYLSAAIAGAPGAANGCNIYASGQYMAISAGLCLTVPQGKIDITAGISNSAGTATYQTITVEAEVLQ